jgi:hypothetical protein
VGEREPDGEEKRLEVRRDLGEFHHRDLVQLGLQRLQVDRDVLRFRQPCGFYLFYLSMFLFIGIVHIDNPVNASISVHIRS